MHGRRLIAAGLCGYSHFYRVAQNGLRLGRAVAGVGTGRRLVVLHRQLPRCGIHTVTWCRGTPPPVFLALVLSSAASMLRPCRARTAGPIPKRWWPWPTRRLGQRGVGVASPRHRARAHEVGRVAFRQPVAVRERIWWPWLSQPSSLRSFTAVFQRFFFLCRSMEKRAQRGLSRGSLEWRAQLDHCDRRGDGDARPRTLPVFASWCCPRGAALLLRQAAVLATVLAVAIRRGLGDAWLISVVRLPVANGPTMATNRAVFPFGGSVHIKRAPVDFFPDNLRWRPDGRSVAGQLAAQRGRMECPHSKAGMWQSGS